MSCWRAAVVATCFGAGLILAADSHAQQPAPRVMQPAAPATQGQPHFRTAVRLTTITATVTDGGGRLVHDLSRDAFEVFEDGEPQTITQFTSDRVPVSIAVLVD